MVTPLVGALYQEEFPPPSLSLDPHAGESVSGSLPEGPAVVGTRPVLAIWCNVSTLCACSCRILASTVRAYQAPRWVCKCVQPCPVLQTEEGNGFFNYFPGVCRSLLCTGLGDIH